MNSHEAALRLSPSLDLRPSLSEFLSFRQRVHDGGEPNQLALQSTHVIPVNMPEERCRH